MSKKCNKKGFKLEFNQFEIKMVKKDTENVTLNE